MKRENRKREKGDWDSKKCNIAKHSKSLASVAIYSKCLASVAKLMLS
jgi:hypothetical protein